MRNLSPFEESLAEKGFITSRRCLCENYKGLYIDDEHKTWTITGSNMSKLRRFSFSQIIDYELYENGLNTISGRAGSALVGGLIAGTAGAIIGSARKKSIDGPVTIQLRITVNDIKTPSIIFEFPTFMVKKGSYSHTKISEKGHQMISMLAYMVNNPEVADE